MRQPRVALPINPDEIEPGMDFAALLSRLADTQAVRVGPALTAGPLKSVDVSQNIVTLLAEKRFRGGCASPLPKGSRNRRQGA
jgi:hypothetical protein